MYEFLKELKIMEWLGDMSGGFTIIVYVLQALALYSIAKRRCIKKPWLAWVPVANVWILGSISDQYQYVAKGEVKNKRKSLLILNIVLAALCFVLIMVLIWAFLGFLGILFLEPGALNNPSDWVQEIEQQLTAETLLSSLGVVALLLSVFLLPVGVAIAYAIVFWKAVYDLFRSCDPNNSVVYLLVSILGGFVIKGLYSVFLLVCRNKDLGMPPRKPTPEVVVEPVVENPVD